MLNSLNQLLRTGVSKSLSLLAGPAAACVLAILPAAAFAMQEASELKPPNPGDVKGPNGLMVSLVMILLVGMVVFAATLPSKRGHQD